MRRAWIAVIAVAVLAMPSAAFAHGDDGSESARRTAPRPVRRSAPQMGADLFRDTYGRNHSKRNAHGKCVSKHRHVFKKLVAQAIEECKAQRAASRFRHFDKDDDAAKPNGEQERVPAMREGEAARTAGRAPRRVRGCRENLRCRADG